MIGLLYSMGLWATILRFRGPLSLIPPNNTDERTALPLNRSGRT